MMSFGKSYHLPTTVGKMPGAMLARHGSLCSPSITSTDENRKAVLIVCVCVEVE